jgi:acetyltransferase-like isoleucine patch superfamily enzyme
MIRRIFNKLVLPIFLWFPYFKFIRETRETQTPITFITWFLQKVIGINNGPYWPMHFSSTISGGWRNVYAGIEVSPGLSHGCYIQAIGKIFIDDYTQIAPNVGIISSNHLLEDNSKHKIGDIRIGKYCWIGMGAVILPGVVLGDFTVVGAGAIVTKSFPDGYCVIAGNPAKFIKNIEHQKCVSAKSKFEYNGYFPAKDFELFAQKELNIKK